MGLLIVVGASQAGRCVEGSMVRTVESLPIPRRAAMVARGNSERVATYQSPEAGAPVKRQYRAVTGAASDQESVTLAPLGACIRVDP
jgi:hypothetical protein